MHTRVSVGRVMRRFAHGRVRSPRTARGFESTGFALLRGMLARAYTALFVGFSFVSGVEAVGSPEEVGQWLLPQPWPVIAIHAALLPTGEVLHYSYPAGGDGSRAMTWNPESGRFEDVAMYTDIFCSGLSFLPDGALYVTGGNDVQCGTNQFRGRQVTNLFDPFTHTWTPSGDMTVGRWYPTNVTLGDGRVIILSGLGVDCKLTPVMEMFTPGVGLEVIPEGEGGLPLYPRMHLLTSGKIALVGSSPESYTFDPARRVWEYVDTSSGGWRGSGTSVLVPGQQDMVMIIGGGNDGSVTNTCERIDFSAAVPQWQPTGSMTFGRAHANVVILPDRKVMVIGGGVDGLYGKPVNDPEMYDPDTESWTVLPQQHFGRMYHSTAVLLPDGRVLSAGQNEGPSGEWGEIYKPAYLFRGPRPEITDAPMQIGYGESFLIASPAAATISSVALIRLTTVTHSVNTEQRYVGLQLQVIGGDSLEAIGPPDGNHAPPGYYMLFIVNDDGVPSVAQIVQLIGGQPVPIPTVSEWGLVVIAILLLTAGTIIFRNRRVLAT